MPAVTPATPADLPFIADLNLRAYAEFADGLAPGAWEVMRAHLANVAAKAEHARFLVVRHEEQIVGSVAYCPAGKSDPLRFEPEMASLLLLAVDPGYRGQGIARRLAEACIACAREDGAAVLALFTSSLMEPAQALYRSLDFQLESELPPRYGIRYFRFVLPLDVERRTPPLPDPRRYLIALGFLSCVGCSAAGDADPSRAPSSSVAASVPPTEQATRMEGFLALSIATRDPKQRNPDSLFLSQAGPGETWQPWLALDHARWLADYHVVNIDVQGDSAFATVRITSVADVVESGSEADRFIGTIGVLEDTAHWVMLRGPFTQNRWKVRGDAVEGFSFNTSIRDVSWKPSGASAAKAGELVDSIRKARGLTILR